MAKFRKRPVVVDACFVALALLMFGIQSLAAATYYVDWATGSDTNVGTSMGFPWKHAPGDDNAASHAAITLQPGDTVVFKGGVVYQGTATQDSYRRVVFPNNSGTSGNPITLISGHMHSSAWGTGDAIIDGGGPGAGAAKTGIYVWNHAWITIIGFDIRNMGVPTTDAAGIEFERGGGTPGVDNAIVRSCLIHHINWSGSYVIGYGIENNRGANHLYEKNEIYDATDKLIETYGGGSATPGTDQASNAIIRYNILHDAAVHCVVLTSDNAQFYDNLIWQCNNGGLSGLSPNPGFALKVDGGRNNKIFNNIAYKVNAGWGVLIGTGNTFAHNVVYGLGLNGSGVHGSADEACLVFYNNDGGWGTSGAGIVDNNHFYNNICYHDPFLPSNDPLIYFNAVGGSGNEVKRNVLYAQSGDISSTANRVYSNAGTQGNGGPFTFRSVSGFEPNFNSDFGGSGNVASGNVVADPQFSGGTLGALTNLPTAFNEQYTDVNTDAFSLLANSPAKIEGIVLDPPMNVDLRGHTRNTFWAGVYGPAN